MSRENAQETRSQPVHVCVGFSLVLVQVSTKEAYDELEMFDFLEMPLADLYKAESLFLTFTLAGEVSEDTRHRHCNLAH